MAILDLQGLEAESFGGGKSASSHDCFSGLSLALC
jgi:hypothetical protein